MTDDPYSAILRMMREQAGRQIPAFFRFGTVRSADPLRISVGTTEQSGSDLLKNAGAGGLHEGDSVLLASMDNDQKFIVLCRVVSV
jgi:hypothetical protein